MVEVMDFSTIKITKTFKLKIKLKTPLHIGGNFDDVKEIDLPVIKTSDNTAYIPGSSLKGVLRSASERMFHVLNLEKDACYLVSGGCSQTEKNKISEILENKKINEKEAYKQIYNLVCPVCRTYGTGAIFSKVKVKNVVLEEGQIKSRDGIMIDRETGAVAPKAKFDYEYVEEGTDFELVIETENMTLENEKVLALALAQIKNNMIRLGGLQARGLGELEYIEGNVYTKEFNNKNAIKYLLEGNEGEIKSLDNYLNKILGVDK